MCHRLCLGFLIPDSAHTPHFLLFLHCPFVFCADVCVRVLTRACVHKKCVYTLRVYVCKLYGCSACTCTCARTCMCAPVQHVCMRLHACVHVCACVCTHMHASTCAMCVHVCTRAHMYVHVRACMCTHMCVQVCAHTCVCVHTCLRPLTLSVLGVSPILSGLSEKGFK